jgi:ABC-2 type transport system permease protein
MGRPVPRPEVDATVAALFARMREDPPLTVVEETVGARPDAVAIFLPGLVTMFTLFSITLTSVNIVNERKNGTLERLMTTRLTRGELMTGSWLGSLGRGLVQVVLFFSLAALVFRIFTPGSFLAVLAFSAVAVASVAGLGLVIASLSRTADQANWTAVFLTMVMSVLGGSFFEVSGSTGVVDVLSRLTYNFWANDGLRRIIVRGESLASPAILQDMAVLLGIAVLGWAVALAFFRLRGDER